MPTACRVRHGGKVFRDPIHKLIRIDREDEFILDLIDTPEFQRLRRIRQLGVSWLTFHGAEHSRFVHSLGVFNFAQRIIEQLKRRYAGHEVEEYLASHEKVVKAAALLHDIGHGPFSHMIERAFGASGAHEQVTVSLIRDPDSGVGNVLRTYGVDSESVARLIDHTSPHQLLVDIVSSQLDADRMDYLLRDSYCTGVQYGVYDAEWILNAMCIGADRDGASHEDGQRRLCLDRRRGERAAEQFVLARAHMNEQVYFHRATRGYEAMLLALFAEASRLALEDHLPDSTPAVVKVFLKQKGKISRASFLQLDEAQMITAFHQWAGSNTTEHRDLREWSVAFLERQRPFGSATISKLDPLKIMSLGSDFRGANLVEGKHWHYDNASSSVYKGVLYSAASDQDSEEQRLESIFLASGSPKENASPIEFSSELVQSLDKKKQSLSRIYLDKRFLSTISPILQRHKLTLDSPGGDA